MPCAPQLPCLIPYFLNLRVVLNNDSVLKEGATARLRAVPIKTVLCVASCSTRVDANVEVDAGLSGVGSQVDAVSMTVVSFGEDDAIEGLVKLDSYFHQILFALDVQVDDFRSVRSDERPGFVASCRSLRRHLPC